MLNKLFAPATTVPPGTRNFARGPAVTVSVTLFDVLELKLLSLAMVAVIAFDPTPRALVVQLALSAERGIDVQPVTGLVVPLSVVLKLTLPVGTMPVEGVAAATKVTALLIVDDPLRGETLNEGVALLTVCPIELEPASKLESLARLAVMLLEPAMSALVVQVAFRLGRGPVTRTNDTEVQPGIALVVPLSVVPKLTLPVGVIPLAGETEAVKVTTSLTLDVEPLEERLNVGIPCVMVRVALPEVLA
jgi:hypothetical protein